MPKLLRPLSLLLLIAGFLAASRADAAGPATVAVQPLQVFNAPDLASAAPGLQAALAGRLAAPGYRVLTPGAGEAVDADWTVRTSMTRLGATLTLDAALEPRDAAQGARRAFQTAESVDALLPAIEALAAGLKTELEQAQPAAPAVVQAPLAAVSLPGAAPAASSPAPVPAAAPALLPLAYLQAGVSAELAQALLHYRTGPSIPGKATGLAVADVDRDGVDEILVLEGDRLHAFRDERPEFRAVWTAVVKGVPNPSLLSIGDGDGDGTPDVFVAGLSDDKAPITRVYQWSGSELTEHGPPIRAFVRAVPYPQQGTVVTGLAPGLGKDLFAPSASTFSWQDGAYRPSGTLSLPQGLTPVNLDWCGCGTGGQVLAAATTTADAFRVYDAEYRELYQSDESVKGAATTLFGAERNRDGDADMLRVGARTAFYTAPDGTVYWLLHKNHGAMARLFEKTASFTHGQWLAYRWDGLTLVPAAVGPKLPGYFADLDLGRTPGAPGRRTLYTALVQKQGILQIEYATRLLAADL